MFGSHVAKHVHRSPLNHTQKKSWHTHSTHTHLHFLICDLSCFPHPAFASPLFFTISTRAPSHLYDYIAFLFPFSAFGTDAPCRFTQPAYVFALLLSALLQASQTVFSQQACICTPPLHICYRRSKLLFTPACVFYFLFLDLLQASQTVFP